MHFKYLRKLEDAFQVLEEIRGCISSIRGNIEDAFQVLEEI